MNKALRQLKISDIDFVTDSELNVLSATRSFYRFFNEPEEKVSLKKYLSEDEAEHVAAFLNGLKDEKEETGAFRFIVRDNPALCIFSAIKQGKSFSVHLIEFNYCRDLFEDYTKQLTEYKAVFNSIDLNYCVCDGKKIYIKNTKDSSKHLEVDEEGYRSFFEKNLSVDLNSEENRDISKAIIEDMMAGTGEKNYTFINTKGRKIIIRTTSAHGNVVAVVHSGRKTDFSEQAFIDTKDGLTGILNRKTVIGIARSKIEESKTPCSVIIIDVDKFKDFNDNFGHDFGDKVLVKAAEVIKNSVESFGFAGRIGGDEFFCVVDTVSEEDLRTITRNIKLGIQWSLSAGSTAGVVTCSIGIARFPENGTTYEELFKLADKCLYIAKNKGRNCYVIYKPEIHDKVIVNNEKKAAEILSGQLFKTEADFQLKILDSLNSKNFVLGDVLNMLLEYTNVSCITLYDKNFNVFKTAGKFIEDFRKEFFKKDYFKYYNQLGYLHLDNVNVFDTLSKETFDMYLKVNVASTLEIKLKDKEGKDCGLICFDVYKPARTFPKEKIIFALMCAQIISEKI